MRFILSVTCVLLSAPWWASCCHQKKPFFVDTGPLVVTTGGKLVGKYVEVSGVRVAAFLGIPFADPPPRFAKAAKLAPPWQGILLAHDKPPGCMQDTPLNYSWAPPPGSRLSEQDCLRLNVWTTAAPSASKNLLPVMVWIHGGGFSVGSSGMGVYDGAMLASFGESVVVSLNYRLGALGFLSAGTEEAPGNAALTDQALALDWVRDNIANFGGDRDRITLFGESAGSMSVSMHMTSPVSRGKFHRAILQSGTAYGFRMLDSAELATEKARHFAKFVGCEDDEGMVRCLRAIDATSLIRLEKEFTAATGMRFLPSYGNEFQPQSPAFESGDFEQIDVLIGLTRDEGTVFLPLFAADLIGQGQPKVTLATAKAVFRRMFGNEGQSAMDKIESYYLQDKDDQEEADLTGVVADAVGDYVMNCPSALLASRLDKGYMYWMSHRSARDPSDGWLGASHFSDVAYVFGGPVTDTARYTPEDGRFSSDLMHKWLTFARDGHPFGVGGALKWRRYSVSDPVAYELNPRNPGMVAFPRQAACSDLWRANIAPAR